MILDNQNTSNKYSKAFNNLKNVFELEVSDKHKFTPKFIKKFEEIKGKYLNFMSNIPLQVVEKYYFLNHEELDKYVYLEYQDKEISECKIMDLYLELEDFFNEIFSLACEIANYYNLEIKLNDNSKEETFI